MPVVVETEAAIRVLAEAGCIDAIGDDVGWRSALQIRLDNGPSFVALADSATIMATPTSPHVSFSSEMQFVDNRYIAVIEFSEPVNFYRVLAQCHTFVRLCEFSYGLEISLKKLQLHRPDVDRMQGGQEHKFTDFIEIEIFDLDFGTRRKTVDVWASHRLGDWRDAFVAPAHDRAEFETVVSNWFNSDGDRSVARARLLDGFRHGSAFTNERLIGACAAFELLPQNARPTQNAPKDVLLLADHLKAKINETDIPEDWKNRLKQSVGMAKTIKTRDIIEHRILKIRSRIPEFLPNCETGVIHAVKLRNRLIHGTPTKLSEEDNQQFLPFFTELLELIFVFSDLIECGYREGNSEKRMLPQGNPLGAALISYNSHMKSLNEAIEKLSNNKP